MPRYSLLQFKILSAKNFAQNCIVGLILQDFDPQESGHECVCDLPHLKLDFFGKPIGAVFYTNISFSTVNLKARFIHHPISIHHALWARRVVKRFTDLYPKILHAFKEREPDFENIALMNEQLHSPRICFSNTEPSGNWSFEVERKDLKIYYVASFEKFELVDCFSGG
jgi:hypothetical protein